MTCKEVCRWYTTFVKVIAMLQAVMKVLSTCHMPSYSYIDLITEQLAVRIVDHTSVQSKHNDVCMLDFLYIGLEVSMRNIYLATPALRGGMVELNGAGKRNQKLTVSDVLLESFFIPRKQRGWSLHNRITMHQHAHAQIFKC